METKENNIVFIVVASVCMIALMLFVVIDLFLRYKNRQLRHLNEMLDLNSKFEKEILEVKNEVTEQVFNDIASELHDNVCQTLSLAVIHINHLESKDGAIHSYVSNARNSISQALNDIRSLSHTLSSDYWKNYDIYKYLKGLKDRIGITNSITVNFNIEPYIEFDTKDQEIIVIRVLQELVNNTIKHSKASNIDLSVTREKEGIHLIYQDNGVGLAETNTSDGMGMFSIKQRLKLLNADWHFNHGNEKGFKLDSKIPILKEYE